MIGRVLSLIHFLRIFHIGICLGKRAIHIHMFSPKACKDACHTAEIGSANLRIKWVHLDMQQKLCGSPLMQRFIASGACTTTNWNINEVSLARIRLQNQS